jgi:hypothetical protein
VTSSGSISALTIENLFYSASVVLMLAAGSALFLLSFPVPAPIRLASLATVAASIVAVAVAGWIVMTRRPIASRLIERLAGRRSRPTLQLREIENRIFRFAGRRPARVFPIAVLEASYHAAAVAEIWVVLTIVTGSPPALVTAFVLEYVNRTITIVFQFIPMWLGVDEAGTGLVASILGVGAAAGVGLALIRKARTLVWTAVGLAVLVRHGLTPKGAVREAELIAAEQ